MRRLLSATFFKTEHKHNYDMNYLKLRESFKRKAEKDIQAAAIFMTLSEMNEINVVTNDSATGFRVFFDIDFEKFKPNKPIF